MENSNVETPKANPAPEFEPLASQISELVTVDSTAEEKKLNDEIDLMLHKISEFMEILEMIRSDTNMCVNSTLPLITEKSRALEQTFDRIDKLEVMMSHIDQTLIKLEQQVKGAEANFSTFSTLKKKMLGALSSIGRSHQDTSPVYQRPAEGNASNYEKVEIFSTSDFFPDS